MTTPSPSHIIRSMLTLGASQMITWIGATALAIFLPRLLGDANLGKLAFAFSLVHLVGLIADLGSATYLTKEIARNPDQAARLTGSALLMKVPLSIAAILAAITVAYLGNFDDISKKVVLIMCFSILLDSLTNTILAALQGVHDMRTLAITSTVTKTVYAVLAVLALLAGAGPVKVAIAAVVSLLVGLGIAYIALRRSIPLKFEMSSRLWKSVILGGLPFFVWQASHAIYAEVDTVLLSILTNDSVVGWYAAAYRIVTIPAFVAVIVTTVMFPVFSAASLNREQFRTIAQQALHYVALLSLPMGLGIMVLAPQIIGMFKYPSSFDNSILPIALLAPHLPMAAIGTVLGTVLTARDRHRAWALTGVGAAILNPLLNFVLIPVTQQQLSNGAIGASIATTLTEVYLLGVGIWLMPKDIFTRRDVVNVSRSLAAGIAMLLPVWWLAELPIVIPVLAGALTYLGAGFLFGAITISDIREVNLRLIRPRIRSNAPEPMGSTP